MFCFEYSRSDIHRAIPCGNLFSATTTCHVRLREPEYLATSTPTMDTVQISSPLPLSSHAKPVDSFAQAGELESELKRAV
jgi:hypothetical protein